MSYGRRQYQKKQLPVYEVNEDDWDENGEYIGQDEGGWDEQEEEDEVEWFAVQSSTKSKVVEEREPSDVTDSVYFDDLALVNCWESALSDYKVSTIPLRQLSLLSTD